MNGKNKKEFHSFESYQPTDEKSKKSKSKKIAALNKWLKKHKKTVLLMIITLAIILGGTLAYLFSTLQYGGEFTPFMAKPAEKVYSPLAGVEVEENASRRPVTAVMIENSPEARPQSGLKDCGVTFEAIAEAGITRFLCLYQEAQPELIGPVRSLRPYYIQWLSAFDPTVAHVGGSAKALAEIRNGSYKDLDQFSNAQTYWRAKDRRAPHNVYTNFKNLNEANQSKKFTTSVFKGFSRKDDAPAATPNATAISVPVSSTLFNSSYQYDAATNSYARSQANKPHLDREKGQISSKVVIVLQTAYSTINEDGPRESIQTIGTGAATIFQDGLAIPATWSKKSKTDQLTFTDATNKNIDLNRGQTWITAVPTTKVPTWK